ncbi:MAG: T9SS type A sorting domain-containing protein, partial [Tunicatimonas sp.]|uniref:T9SS type A sorting domain-containing protein n=1 Tax=Tunicatimonas sp. TaxID=1940096 RepID=UPI003C71D469
SWSNWVTTQIKPVFISAGEHQVRLLAIGDSGPNVDWLRLSPTRYFTPNTETSAARIANTEKATSADPEVLPSQPEVVFYPNPVVNQIHLALPTGHSSGELDVQIMDVNGREVYRNRWTGDTEDLSTIDATSWQEGTYFYRITTNKQTVRGKLIKSY